MQQSPLSLAPRLFVPQAYANNFIPFRPISSQNSNPAPTAPMLYQQPWPIQQPYNTRTQPFSNAMPTAETAKSRLTTQQGAIAGLKSGLLFSALVALPLFGIEHLLGKTMIKKKFIKDYHQPGFDLRNANLAGENLLANFSQFIERAIHMQSELSGNPKDLAWTRKFINQYKIPASIASTSAICLMAGAGLGAWLISRTRKRLVEINEVQQQQNNGTFKPKPTTLLQRLGLSEKPVVNPNQSYQDLLQTHLSTTHAFKQVALAVLLFKTIPGLFGAVFPFGVYYGLKSVGKAQFIDRGIEKCNLTFNQVVISTFHPVLLAKMAALPVIGGMIAVQTVPWMRKQLGLQNS